MAQVIPITAPRRRAVCPRCSTEMATSLQWAAGCPVCASVPAAAQHAAAAGKTGFLGSPMRRDTARRSSRRAATPLENAPTPTVVDELASLDKTLGSFLAFVPVYGLFRIQQSEAHSADEKFRLSTLSLGATLLLLVGLLMLLPSAAEQHSQMQSRIDREIRVLYDVAEQYRAQHGRYPELPIWQRLARRADPRFYDPWGRPYRYEADDVKGVAIGTLGRDGIAKGRQDDSDLWLHFSPLGGSTSSSPEG